jgi:hypothetical protein
MLQIYEGLPLVLAAQHCVPRMADSLIFGAISIYIAVC